MLEASKRVLGEGHLETLSSMSNLALTWKSLGRDQDAMELMQRVLHLRTDILGSEHSYTVASAEILDDWTG